MFTSGCIITSSLPVFLFGLLKNLNVIFLLNIFDIHRDLGHGSSDCAISVYENRKAKISKEGIEWLCKNCFKQKYLELLEEYKMELTEKYIEAGYPYDVFLTKYESKLLEIDKYLWKYIR